MISLFLCYSVYVIVGLSVSFYALTRDDKRSPRDLWLIIALWPLCLVGDLIRVFKR